MESTYSNAAASTISYVEWHRVQIRDRKDTNSACIIPRWIKVKASICPWKPPGKLCGSAEAGGRTPFKKKNTQHNRFVCLTFTTWPVDPTSWKSSQDSDVIWRETPIQRRHTLSPGKATPRKTGLWGHSVYASDIITISYDLLESGDGPSSHCNPAELSNSR